MVIFLTAEKESCHKGLGEEKKTERGKGK